MGGQGGCERRTEVILEMHKKMSGGGIRVDVNEELEVIVKMQKSEKKSWGRVRVGGSGWM